MLTETSLKPGRATVKFATVPAALQEFAQFGPLHRQVTVTSSLRGHRVDKITEDIGEDPSQLEIAVVTGGLLAVDIVACYCLPGGQPRSSTVFSKVFAVVEDRLVSLPASDDDSATIVIDVCSVEQEEVAEILETPGNSETSTTTDTSDEPGGADEPEEIATLDRLGHADEDEDEDEGEDGDEDGDEN